MIQVQIEVVSGFSNLMMLQDTQCYKVFGHCDFLLYISCKTTFLKNIIPKSTLFLMIFLSIKTELNVDLHCNLSINL